MFSIGAGKSDITAACETLTRIHPALVVYPGMFEQVRHSSRGVGSKDQLSSYFERMAMEERRKLEMFRPENGQPVAAPSGGTGTLR